MRFFCPPHPVPPLSLLPLQGAVGVFPSRLPSIPRVGVTVPLRHVQTRVQVLVFVGTPLRLSAAVRAVDQERQAAEAAPLCENAKEKERRAVTTPFSCP